MLRSNLNHASKRGVGVIRWLISSAWWRHQMETFSALLAICAGNSPVPGEFLAQRPVTRSFDVFFDLRVKNGWVNNGEAGDLRRYRAHYDVTVMSKPPCIGRDKGCREPALIDRCHCQWGVVPWVRIYRINILSYHLHIIISQWSALVCHY